MKPIKIFCKGKMKKTAFLFPIFLALSAGCSVGPSYKQPCAEVPAGWKNQQNEKCDAQSAPALTYLDYWWEIFHEPRLNELEQWALVNNRELYIAYERVQEYRALMGVAASNFYPQVTLNPLYTNTGELIKNYAPPVPNTPANLQIPRLFRAHELLYSLPFNLSYEVDLWGKLRDIYASAKYDYLSQQKQYETAILSLTSSLATAYYQLRTADAQIDLLRRILVSRKNALQINEDRFEDGIVFYSDVALAAEEVDSVTTQLEEVIRQRKVLENEIAVLIGVPASELQLEFMPLVGLPPCVPENLPSEVLLQRPDIAAAEFSVRSQHALVKEAYTQFFPSLILTGSLGYESPVFKEFLKWLSRFWMMGAQANQLVFDGFRTPYNVAVQMARLGEAGGNYQQTILVAFQEVEDALVNLASYAREYDSAVATSNWAERAFGLYKDRYNLGVINYIDVVNTERDWLNYEIQSVGLQGNRFLATIELIRALGGDWTLPDAVDSPIKMNENEGCE